MLKLWSSSMMLRMRNFGEINKPVVVFNIRPTAIAAS